MLAAVKCHSFSKWFEIKWLPGLGSNLGALLISNILPSVNGRFNADCLTNSMLGRTRQIQEWKVRPLNCARCNKRSETFRIFSERLVPL
jgi:hypothetical protein